MTVRELIELLKTKPQEVQVIVTWEGTAHPIEDDSAPGGSNVYMSHDGVLVIDADGCQDKEEIMTGKRTPR